MSIRPLLTLSIALGLCATGCPESKTETAPEPKSPEQPAAAGEAKKADEGAKEEGAKEGEKKEEEGGW